MCTVYTTHIIVTCDVNISFMLYHEVTCDVSMFLMLYISHELIRV